MAANPSADVAASLTAVKRAAETCRSSLGQLDLVTAPAEEVASRLAAAAHQLNALRGAIQSDPALRYQAVRPVALPGNPAHVPEFLLTRKEAAQVDADAAAEAAGAAAATTTSEHTAAAAALVAHFDRLAAAALADFRAIRASAARELGS